MNKEPIVVERELNAPVSRVWQALTDKNKMKQWYFDVTEFKAEPGFEFSFLAGTEEKKFLHLCRVTEAVFEKKLSYTWAYENVPVETLVSFELFDLGNNKTRLKLTHTGVENFPADQPDFARQNFVEGWTEIIGNSIGKFVEN